METSLPGMFLPPCRAAEDLRILLRCQGWILNKQVSFDSSLIKKNHPNHIRVYSSVYFIVFDPYIPFEVRTTICFPCFTKITSLLTRQGWESQNHLQPNMHTEYSTTATFRTCFGVQMAGLIFAAQFVQIFPHLIFCFRPPIFSIL